MRNPLIILLMLFAVSVSLGQEEIYWPDHEGMTGARWSPDGSFIATWGESPVVRIWNDHDGSLALELDISGVTFELPNGESLDISEGFAILSHYWSDDRQYIITYVVLHDKLRDYFKLVWKAVNGKLVYALFVGSYVRTGREYWASYRVEGRRYFRRQHQVVLPNELAASWYENRMTFIDISADSVSVGESMTTVNLGETERATDGYWNDTNTEFLLPPSAYGYCADCPDSVKLYDMDLNSATFGHVLWSRDVFKESHVFAWPNKHDLLAIRVLDKIEVWDLDRNSEQFGTKLLDIGLQGPELHAVHYDERHRSLIVGDIQVVKHEGSLETYIPFICLDYECILNISVWDVDLESPSYGESVKVLSHPYKIYWASDAAAENDNRMHLNTSKTQLHVYSAENKPGSLDDLEFTLNAYDLETFEIVEATDKAPKHAVGPDWFWSAALHRDFEHGWNVNNFWVSQHAFHLDGKKIILRVKDHVGPNADRLRWFIVDTKTRKCFAPPLGWQEYRAGAGC